MYVFITIWSYDCIEFEGLGCFFNDYNRLVCRIYILRNFLYATLHACNHWNGSWGILWIRKNKEMCFFFQIETYPSVKWSFLLTFYRFLGCKTLLQIPKFWTKRRWHRCPCLRYSSWTRSWHEWLCKIFGILHKH